MLTVTTVLCNIIKDGLQLEISLNNYPGILKNDRKKSGNSCLEFWEPWVMNFDLFQVQRSKEKADELVTDVKYFVVFYTQVIVRNKAVQLTVLLRIS